MCITINYTYIMMYMIIITIPISAAAAAPTIRLEPTAMLSEHCMLHKIKPI